MILPYPILLVAPPSCWCIERHCRCQWMHSFELCRDPQSNCRGGYVEWSENLAVEEVNNEMHAGTQLMGGLVCTVWQELQHAMDSLEQAFEQDLNLCRLANGQFLPNLIW